MNFFFPALLFLFLSLATAQALSRRRLPSSFSWEGKSVKPLFFFFFINHASFSAIALFLSTSGLFFFFFFTEVGCPSSSMSPDQTSGRCPFDDDRAKDGLASFFLRSRRGCASRKAAPFSFPKESAPPLFSSKETTRR